MSVNLQLLYDVIIFFVHYSTLLHLSPRPSDSLFRRMRVLLEHGGGSLWYRTDCGSVHRLCTCGDCLVSSLMYRPHPAARQVFSYKWGAVGWGEQHMLMFDCSALMTPRKPPWTACVHVRDSYPIDVSQLNFNILCLLCAVTLGIYLGDCAFVNRSTLPTVYPLS